MFVLDLDCLKASVNIIVLIVVPKIDSGSANVFGELEDDPLVGVELVGVPAAAPLLALVGGKHDFVITRGFEVVCA